MIVEQAKPCEYCGAVGVTRQRGDATLRRCCVRGYTIDVWTKLPPSEVAKELENQLAQPEDWWPGPPDAQVSYKGVNFR